MALDLPDRGSVCQIPDRDCRSFLHVSECGIKSHANDWHGFKLRRSCGKGFEQQRRRMLMVLQNVMANL